MYDDDRSDEDISKEQSKWTSDEIKRYDTSKLFTRIDVVEKQKKKEETRKKTAALVDENYRSMGHFFGFLFERWHKFVTIPLIILVIAGITMPLWYEPLVNNIRRQNAEQAAEEKAKSIEEYKNTSPHNFASYIAQEARPYLMSGDIETANSIYEEGMKSADTDARKGYLYAQWGTELYQYAGESQITTALEYIQNAEALNIQELQMYTMLNNFYWSARIKEKSDYYSAKINELVNQQDQGEGVGEAIYEKATIYC